MRKKKFKNKKQKKEKKKKSNKEVNTEFERKELDVVNLIQ